MLAAGDDALILVPRPASAPAQAYRGAKIGIGVSGSDQSVHELAVYGAALKGKIVPDARRRNYRSGSSAPGSASSCKIGSARLQYSSYILAVLIAPGGTGPDAGFEQGVGRLNNASRFHHVGHPMTAAARKHILSLVR